MDDSTPRKSKISPLASEEKKMLKEKPSWEIMCLSNFEIRIQIYSEVSVSYWLSLHSNVFFQCYVHAYLTWKTVCRCWRHRWAKTASFPFRLLLLRDFRRFPRTRRPRNSDRHSTRSPRRWGGCCCYCSPDVVDLTLRTEMTGPTLKTEEWRGKKLGKQRVSVRSTWRTIN